jgi:hypothetical protein
MFGFKHYSLTALDIENKWKSSLHGTTHITLLKSPGLNDFYQGSGLLGSSGLFIVFHYIIDTEHQCSECIVNK